MNDSQKHWDQKYRQNPELNPYSEFLPAVEKYLPRSGDCVDIAGGNGRNALWFAEKNFTTSLVDVSGVALDQAKEASHSRGVELECIQRDVERNSLPLERKWDIALITFFLDRDLIMQIPKFLNESGIFLFAHPTKKNLERHENPSSRFLLEDSEIFDLAENLDSMKTEYIDEGWRTSGKHEAWMVCKKLPE